MTVLYDHQIFQVQKYGGISRYFHEIISRAAQCPELEVALFLGLNINGYGLNRSQEKYLRFFGLQRPEIPKTTPLFVLANQLLFPWFLRKSNPAVYHQTYYSEFAPHFKGLRVVTVYDMIHEVYPRYFAADDPTPALKKRAVDRADVVLAISHSTKRDLMRFCGTPERKIVVTPLANSLTAKPQDFSLVDAPYFLFVGGRAGYKNFEFMLKAFCAHDKVAREFKLVCFGGGPLTDRENEIIRRHQLDGRVLNFSGADEILATLYKHATALVYPSLYEGFGLPILEAMHYGCPVLTSSSSSIPEVAGDAALYFDPLSRQQFVSQLERIALSAAERERLNALGRVQEQKFNWDLTFKATLESYNLASRP